MILGEHDLVLAPGEAAELDTRVPHWFGSEDVKRRPAVRASDGKTAGRTYRTSSPVTARPTIIRWISEVPSKMVKIRASRCQRSTG